jgi:hypothetical protein
VVIAEYNVIHKEPGALCTHQSLNIKQGGSRCLSGLPGLPANHSSRHGSNGENPPVRLRPPLGPFEGCVPGWRVATGLGLILSAGGLFVWAVRSNSSRMAQGCGVIFLVGSLIWLTGHTDCRETQNRDSQRLEHDTENVSLGYGVPTDPHELAGIFAVGIGHRDEPVSSGVVFSQEPHLSSRFISVYIPNLAREKYLDSIRILSCQEFNFDNLSANQITEREFAGMTFPRPQIKRFRGCGILARGIVPAVYRIDTHISEFNASRRIANIGDLVFHSSFWRANAVNRAIAHDDLGAELKNDSLFGSTRRSARLIGLLRYHEEGEKQAPNLYPIGPTKNSMPTWQVPCGVLCAFIAVFMMGRWGDRPGIELAAFLLILLAGFMILAGYEDGEPEDSYNSNRILPQEYFPQHNTKNVSQKVLTPSSFRITLNAARQDMANVLGTDKKIAVVAALAEGSSIRSIERMTGIHRDTIMRLGVRVGQGCTILMHEKNARLALHSFGDG